MVGCFSIILVALQTQHTVCLYIIPNVIAKVKSILTQLLRLPNVAVRLFKRFITHTCSEKSTPRSNARLS